MTGEGEKEDGDEYPFAGIGDFCVGCFPGAAAPGLDLRAPRCGFVPCEGGLPSGPAVVGTSRIAVRGLPQKTGRRGRRHHYFAWAR